MSMDHRWYYTYRGQEECSQRTWLQSCFIRRKSNMDWFGLEPAPPRWVAPSYGTAWKDLRSIRKYWRDMTRPLLCVTGTLWKKVTFFKVANEFAAFMEPMGHSRVQNSALWTPNQICFYWPNFFFTLHLYLLSAVLVSLFPLQFCFASRPSGGIETHIS